MKKIMIAAAIVCVAVLAQASSVNWGSGTFSNGFASPDGATLKGNGSWTMTMYLYSGDQLIETQSATSVKANGSMGTTATTDLSVGSTYTISAVITGTDAKGKEWTRAASPIEFTHASGSSPDIVTFKTTTVDKWGAWQAAPEPTSGLLMLIGMGALALRRRRA